MVNPSDHVETPTQDSPPHLTGNSIFGIPKLELSKELSAISKPVYKDKLLETFHIMSYHSNIIPRSFAFLHINQMAAKARIIKALELGFNYLRCNKLKVSAELTHTILRKPRIHKVIIQLEDFFENFRVVHNFEDIKGVAPNLDVLASIGKKPILLREEAGDYLVEQGMAIPRPPHWGKNNDPEQWWNINNFEILCASSQHEVEEFLKTVSPYFPRGQKSDNDFPEPHTLTRVNGRNTLVSELPAPRRTKVPRFGDEGDIPPISTTGQGRLIALLEDDTIKIPPTKVNTKRPNCQEDPFSDKGISKELEKFVSTISKPPGPPSNDSSSDSESETAKPPIRRSTK